MRIPVLRLPISTEDEDFIARGLHAIISSGFLTLGKYTEEFEERFAQFSGAHYAIACSSGTAALELILRGLEIEGRSVIVPTNTFLATALAVMHSANQVIFADSDPHTLCLAPADVLRRLTDDTAAVILVHIGGNVSSAVYELRDICKGRGVFLIEDCAHAQGCTIDGKPVATLGIAGAFSFFPTKVLTTGEGGVVVTNDESLATRVKMIRNHGKNPALGDRMSEMGYNHRMSEVTALFGVQQMTKAAAIIAGRRRAASFYDTALKGVDGLRLLSLPECVFSTYYKYVAYLDENIDRASVKAMLKERHEVSLTGEVYADLCHTEPLWKYFTYCGRRRARSRIACHRWPSCGCDSVQGDFPGAEYVSRHHICLPVYPDLSEAELDHVAVSLRKAVKSARMR